MLESNIWHGAIHSVISVPALVYWTDLEELRDTYTLIATLDWSGRSNMIKLG